MKSKRNKWMVASLASAVVATVAVQAPVEAATVFPDVKPDSTHYGPIHVLANEGIVSGFPDGTYRPGTAVTRGQAAKILAGVLGLSTTNFPNPGFKDVPTTHQYYNAIAALASLGVISGFEDDTFRPGATITRGQMSKIIVEGLKLAPKDGGTSNFTDVPAGHQYKGYVDALFTNGITQGQPNGSDKFGVANPVTRGQIATFISRAKEALAPTPTEDFSMTILHQNDIHANLNNIAKTVTAVKEERAKDAEALLVNAGDVFSGTLYFNEYQGQADLAFLNMMGVDAFAFGNHEFDLGSTPDQHLALREFVEKADFPFVAANVDFSEDSNLKDLQTRTVTETAEDGRIYDAIIKEVNGEKVGIFGLTTAETADISSPGSIAFENYIEKAEQTVEQLEEQGIDKIIALTHIGYDDNPAVDNDLQLAAHVDGIDVIVGGHSHTELEEPVVVEKDENGADKDPTLIVQAYQYNEFLGKLEVTFDEDGVVSTYAGELLEIDGYEEDAEAAAVLKTYKERIAEIEQQEIGATATAALVNPRANDESSVSVRNSETALGNLITQGMLTKAKQYAPNAIMALQNGGGIRAAIDAGPITVGEVITVLPFGNTLATMQLTGAELKAAFEHGLSQYPAESGGFLHVAGGRVTFDSTKPAGSRVTKVEYNNNGAWVEVNPATTYTIATNAFTAKGGDGYDMFAKAYAEGRVTDLGLSDWENFAEYLTTLKTVTPQTVGTYTDTKGETPGTGGGGVVTPPIITPPVDTAKALDVTIMHQNDTHARLDNVAKTVTAVKEVRAANENTLLLNAGDVFSGTLYFNQFEGKADVAFMNLMGVDAFVFGNHEFDLGSSPTAHKGLADFLALAKFPTVAANVDLSKDEHLSALQSRTVTASAEDGKVYDAIIQTVDGEKVGIFGLTTEETASISSPGSIVFENYIERAKETVAKLEAQGVNKIIALTHIGYDDNPTVDNDQQLAKQVAGIDVIVGGHSHTNLEVPVTVARENDADDEPTIIVQAYQHNDFLGTLDVSFDKDGVITAHNGELLEIATYADDAEALALLQPYKDKVAEVAGEEIGVTLAQPLTNPRQSDEGNTTGESVRKNETILGNLITEGMLEKAKEYSQDQEVILAFQNGGGIRTSINAGPVTVGEVINVLPFSNTLALATVSGVELYETFEHSVSGLPRESGGFLHVAGGRVTYDATKPVGERIISIETLKDGVYTVVPKDATMHTVATNAFTAKGGDNYAVLAEVYADGRVTDLGLSDWENFRDYLVSQKDAIPTEVRGTLVQQTTVTAADLATQKEFVGNVVVTGTAEELATIDGLQVTGNLIVEATTAAPITISNTTVGGDLVVSNVAGEVTLVNTVVDGDTIN